MKLEDYHLTEDSPIDTSIIKRDFTKIYQQYGARKNHVDRIFEIISGENNIYHENGNSFLQYDITIRKVALPPANEGDPLNPPNPEFIFVHIVRMARKAFAFTFKHTRLARTGGGDIEENKYVSNVSTIMRVLMSTDGDLKSHFDESDESEDGIKNTSIKHMLIKNHNTAAKKEKSRATCFRTIFCFR